VLPHRSKAWSSVLALPDQSMSCSFKSLSPSGSVLSELCEAILIATPLILAENPSLKIQPKKHRAWANQSREHCSYYLNWPFETTCWVSCCCYWNWCSILIPAWMCTQGWQVQMGLLYQNSTFYIWKVCFVFSVLVCVKLISIQLNCQVKQECQHILRLGVQQGIWHHQG